MHINGQNQRILHISSDRLLPPKKIHILHDLFFLKSITRMKLKIKYQPYETVDFCPPVYNTSDMLLFANWATEERVLCKYERR